MKKVCILCHQSPLNSPSGREALDMALIFAAVEQEVTLIMLGSAVLSMKINQQPESIGHKDYLSTFKALALYDVENIIVCKQSLSLFNLTETNLLPNAKVLDNEAIQKLLSEQHHTFSF
ncbi:sulfurtransferase complex subunit TusC [Flocculibacter collagenilyticus]|uniref:sulfurtransferase complex subunit TusC n=1 Tax=Flocculibacter collagenilyticus TaxID=2744479 RepID=UPI0018F33E26|nr:sulfurtransferase complex subunit TusC [Flocculibacter collagenilyticus]